VRSLLLLIVFFLLQGAIAVGIALIRQAAGRDPIPDAEGMLLLFALTVPPLLLVTWGFLRVFDRRGLASLGARWPVGGRRAVLRQALMVPLVVLALFGAWLALLALLPNTTVRSAGTDGGLTGPAGSLRLLVLLAGFLVQGGVEEWLIRGYTYHALRERWRRSVAILASSLLFALLHGLNPDVSAVALINTFLAGVILALLVERSRSLWSAVLAHGVWNFAISSLVSLPVSGVLFPHLLTVSVKGPALLTGDGFGPEGSAVLTLLALPLVAALGFRLPPPATPPKPEIQPEHSAVPS